MCRGVRFIAAGSMLAALAVAAPSATARRASQDEGAAASPAARHRVAVVPFTARGGVPDAWTLLWSAIQASLPSEGFDYVPPMAMYAQMKNRRLRDASILTHEELSSLADAVGADRLLLGEIYRFRPAPEPEVSFSGRLIDPRRLVIESMSFTALEGRTLMRPAGTGGPVTLERVVAEAAGQFVAELGAPSLGRPFDDSERLRRASALAPSPATFILPRLADRNIRRVVVLPFRNQTTHLGAGQAAADVFTWRLVASGQVSLVDAGDAVRRLLVRGWRTGAPVGRAEVLALHEDPGVDAVLMGSVDRWVEGVATGAVPPEINFSARMLDAATGKILWAVEHERRGDQTHTIYGLGNVHLAEILMARSASEVLEPLLRALKGKEGSSTGVSRE